MPSVASILPPLKGTNVRGWLELAEATDGTVWGHFAREGGAAPVSFSGWIELLRVLEAETPHGGAGTTPPTTPQGSPDPGEVEP